LSEPAGPDPTERADAAATTEADGGGFLPDLRAAPHAAPSPRAAGADGARAYARLLVSDIRLYHDMDVVLGRAAGDLASRLETPLREARARYLARHADAATFDREVVSILAGGDPRRLGR